MNTRLEKFFGHVMGRVKHFWLTEILEILVSHDFLKHKQLLPRSSQIVRILEARYFYQFTKVGVRFSWAKIMKLLFDRSEAEVLYIPLKCRAHVDNPFVTDSGCNFHPNASNFFSKDSVNVESTVSNFWRVSGEN